MSSVASPPVGTARVTDLPVAGATPARTAPVGATTAGPALHGVAAKADAAKDAVKEAAGEIKEAVEAAAQDIPALDRLAASRLRLRGAMMEIAHPPPRAPLMGGKIGDLGQRVADRARALPGASLVLETLETWWRKHPLRTVSHVAENATRQILQPIARRNPLGLLFGAAAVGAVLILSRPWRWALRPALLAGLAPQLASLAIRRMSPDTWMKMLGNLTGARRPRATPPPTSGVRASGLP